MNITKGTLLALLALVLATVPAAARQRFGDETLNYKVLFKWGIVQKQAGRATLSLRSNGKDYVSTLYARSEPWADHFYTLRDTLVSTMGAADMLPVRYERIAHEGGRFAHDIIDIRRVENVFVGESTRHRRGKGETEVSTTSVTLQAEGPTVDLLSVFYYLRNIDFANLSAGYTKTINIFSGKKRENLKIEYHGLENLKLEGRNYPTYRISFTFTTDGKTKSSDDIDTWIWVNSTHIPLKLEGKLKVGKIRCLYTGGTVPLKK